ncbi:MAG: dihydroorotate dehydrogenase-like protein [Kiritimatiellae bacterium]|jgi:dihydroorotate dehydrogenase (fumarate)|nr:dihydroorotate dehydrogenase-like protein [Kiritimatiellia bacterium]
MADLKTTYLGLELKNPLVVSSSPVTNAVEGVVSLAEAGAAAVVVKSIFEEQIRSDIGELYDVLEGETSGVAMEYLQADLPGRMGPEKYLKKIKEMRKRVDIPVIASVNCSKSSAWVDYARKIEDAGADALELNLYQMPIDFSVSSNQIEAESAKLVGEVTAAVGMPVTVKLSRHYTALFHFAQSLEKAGAKGVILFNRFLHADINLDDESIFYSPNYSTPAVFPSQLRWAAVLRDMVSCDIAISGGIHSGDEMAKALLVGANVGYVCSAIIKESEFTVIGRILNTLEEWMDAKGYADIESFRGKLRETDLSDGVGFERSQYVKAATELE